MSKARKLADLLDSAGDVAGGKIADDTINSEHFVDGGIDDAHIGDLAASKLTGTVADARMSTLTASKLTGALPAIDGSNLTGITTDTTTIENNIALLGFYRAADHSKEKYSLVDQIIDDYADANGIDAGNSTNEEVSSGYVRGSSTGSTSGATGGTISVSGSNTIHHFLSSATFTPLNSGNVHIVLVGAGGTGGNNNGGGGGGGKLEENDTKAVTAQGYSIVIGEGGNWDDAQYPNNYSFTPDASMAGGDTTGLGMPAHGGNHGDMGDSRTPYGTGTGNQGGGGKPSGSASASYSGNAGGGGNSDAGGGGGGANGTGSGAGTVNGGNGGAGVQNNIDGNNYYYGGGGGGSGKHRDNGS